MQHRYIKASPASKVASQVRHITLDEAVLESLNAFLDALLITIIQEVSSSKQGNILEPSTSTFLHPTDRTASHHKDRKIKHEHIINCPIKTETFKKACSNICGKSNILIKEAILEAELLLNEWTKIKGDTSDPALPDTDGDHNTQASGRGGALLGVPPFSISRRSFSRSTSTLQSITDVGEHEDDEGAVGQDAIRSPVYRQVRKKPSILYEDVLIHSYIAELQEALVHISPLSDASHLPHTFEAYSKGATAHHKTRQNNHTSPLLVLYVSKFLTFIAKELIRGIADIVEMNPRMSEANLGVLLEYIRGNDNLGMIWMKVLSGNLPDSRPHTHTSSLRSESDTSPIFTPHSVRPRSKSEVYLSSSALNRSVSASSKLTTTSKLSSRRLSIDAELARAHSDIISLSRASPVERVVAESIRRKSWGEVEVDIAALTAFKEENAVRQAERRAEEAAEQQRKINGIQPGINEGQEDVFHEESAGVNTTTAMATASWMRDENKDSYSYRPGSSLSIGSSIVTGGGGFIGTMFRRTSMRNKQGMDKDDVYDEKEVAAEMKHRNRSSSRNSSRVPRSSSSMSGRNVMSKSHGIGSRVIGASQSSMREVINEHPRPSSRSSKRPSTSPNGPSTSGARLSEDPDFEDLIMRGDTLRMTLTPSRFRQSSKDGGISGGVYGTPPRKMHGTSSSSNAKRQGGSSRPRGYSNTSRDSPASSSTSLNALSPSALPPFSSSLTPKSAVKLRARPATANQSTILGGDEEETETSSTTDREEALDDEDEAEELNLDSEDEAMLTPVEKKKRQIKLNQKRTGVNDNGRTLKGKESLFDILSSAPPWEDKDGDNQGPPGRGGANGGGSKAERMMGMAGGSGMQSTRSAPKGLQAAGHIGPRKTFAPIANLDMLASTGPPSPIDSILPAAATPGLDTNSIRSRTTAMSDNASTLYPYATPSIADTRSLLTTTTSLDGQSDFFSSKASFALTRKEFPLPPSFSNQQQDSSRNTGGIKKHSSLNPASLSNDTSSNRLNSYKSTPDFTTIGSPSSNGLSGPHMRPMQRRMQAKDEREVDKGVNDDLIAFLRDAGPPPVPHTSFPSAPSQASLPLSSHSGNGTSINTTTTKNRLGSVKFRSFIRGHSKRPSTAPGPNENGEMGSSFGKFATLDGDTSRDPISAAISERRPSGAGLGHLPSVDEMGRLRPSLSNGQNGRSIHGSLLNMGRRQSESRDSNQDNLNSASSIHHTLQGTKHVTGSVPPAAYLAHSAHLQHSTLPSFMNKVTPTTKATTSTMIMTGGHAASPAAKQAEKDWELAKMKERELELEEAKKKLEEERMALKVQQMRVLESAKVLSQSQAHSQLRTVRRDVGPHPTPSVADGVPQGNLLTPEHSRDDLYQASIGQNSTQHFPISNVPISPTVHQAQAISGVDTPPTTPNGKTHTPPQFTPLQPLLEDSEMKVRTSASSVSASPSTVMPGMAHKHQRRLSAVRRKPSPRVEGEDEGGSNSVNQTDKAIASAGGLATSAVLLYSYNTSPHRSREASSSSQSSGLEPAFSTPATKLIEEYRGSSQVSKVEIIESNGGNNLQAGEASIRSVPATVNSITSSTRLVDVINPVTPTITRSASNTRSASTTITSRPPSTVLMPLSPRYTTMSISNGFRGADVHDILLSLRNNMISATSVSDCLEMIDAALFEVAYDTKESKAPSVIEEEEAGNMSSTAAMVKAAHAFTPVQTKEKLHRREEGTQTDVLQEVGEAVVKDAITEAKNEKATEASHARRPRTSRYINRAYDAIIQLYLLDPLAMTLSSRSHYLHPLTSLISALKPLEDDAAISEDTLADRKPSGNAEKASIDVQRTPSLGYSVSASTESDDGTTTANDKTSDTTLVNDIQSVEQTSTTLKRLELVRELTLDAPEEEEQEVLQKATEIV